MILRQSFSTQDRDTFIRYMLTDIPPKPERADEIRAANLGLPNQVSEQPRGAAP